MRSDKLMRIQLDKQLEQVKVALHLSRPTIGWIKSIRIALGMTLSQFARRMKISQPRASAIETAEIANSLTIKTLEEAATSLNCRLVYFLVPETTLKESLKNQAIKTVKQLNKSVSHSMGLENQAESDTDDLIKIQAEELILEHPKKVWEEV